MKCLRGIVDQSCHKQTIREIESRIHGLFGKVQI